jgi:LPXTG-motif cell wall-anchored protein
MGPNGPSCVGVNWAGAADADTGFVRADGDGTYITDEYTVAVAGCYTYVEMLVGDNTTPPGAPSLPGVGSETVLVLPPPTTPHVSTQVSKQTANVGDTITDALTVTGSNGFQGTASSTLLGPVAPLGTATAPTCAGISWLGASIAGTFEVEVDGDGTYITAPYTVEVAGCYTYIETLNTTPPVGPSTPGRPSETTLVDTPPGTSPPGTPPTVSTQISQQRATVGDTITDAIKVSGSNGYQGPVNWTLLGPMAPIRNAQGAPTCDGLNWTESPIAAFGTVTVDGDGTYITAPYTVEVAGCYTYIELLVGDNETPPAGPSTPGKKSETVLVFPPTTPPGLPMTGSDIVPIGLTGLGLLLVGAATLVAGRRRGVVGPDPRSQLVARQAVPICAKPTRSYTLAESSSPAERKTSEHSCRASDTRAAVIAAPRPRPR